MRGLLIALALLPTVALGQSSRIVGYSSRMVPSTNLRPISELEGETLTASVVPGGEPISLTCRTPLRRVLKRLSSGTYWQWADPAAHHRAAVRVIMPSGHAGSGTVIQVNGGRCIVITCQHVVETGSSGTIVWQDGHKSRAQVIGRAAHADTAVMLVDQPPPNVVGVPISGTDAPCDVHIEVMGFGGPGGQLRPYVALTVEDKPAKLAIDAPSISGDSGSGMLWDGCLVGVQFGGFCSPTQELQGWKLVYPASSQITASELAEYVTQICSPYGCEPIIRRPQGQPRQPHGQGGSPFYPPAGREPPPASQPPQDQPSQPAPQQPQQPPAKGCGCDLDAIVDAIKEIEGPPGEQGKQGPVGPMGPRGPAGEPGADGQVTEEHLAAIVASVAQAIKSVPDMKGPKGDKGEQGDQGPPGEFDIASLSDADLDKLAVALAGRLPPITLRIKDPSGKVDEEEIHLGEEMPLRLYPVNQ